MTVLVIARTRDPHRQSEAMRAALGLTLRGARVEVALDGPLLTATARRAADTLTAFGHAVGVDAREALARARAVEVWT
jgi:hypothetical protein